MLWWLLLRVNLTGLRDAQIANKTLFLGVFMRVFPEDISIWIGELSKADDPSQYEWASSNPLRDQIEQKGERGVQSLCLS